MRLPTASLPLDEVPSLEVLSRGHCLKVQAGSRGPRHGAQLRADAVAAGDDAGTEAGHPAGQGLQTVPRPSQTPRRAAPPPWEGGADGPPTRPRGIREAACGPAPHPPARGRAHLPARAGRIQGPARHPGVRCRWKTPCHTTDQGDLSARQEETRPPRDARGVESSAKPQSGPGKRSGGQT